YTLLDAEHVTYEWTTLNGVNGGRFTDIASGKSIFLPAAGYRLYSDGSLYYRGSGGTYWSTRKYSDTNANRAVFSSGGANTSYDYRALGQSVRCITE
ncbi:MAG: hypothetical protein LBB41_02870, partial [Prevotellaceae bacterium]|nr:hypothetical protein [Prevotellaceae bacterium]